MGKTLVKDLSLFLVLEKRTDEMIKNEKGGSWRNEPPFHRMETKKALEV
jgi:hypothetical protein